MPNNNTSIKYQEPNNNTEDTTLMVKAYKCQSCETILPEKPYFKCIVCDKSVCYKCEFITRVPEDYSFFCQKHKKELKSVVNSWLKQRK